MHIHEIAQYLTDFSGIPATYISDDSENLYTLSLPYLPRLATNLSDSLPHSGSPTTSVLTDELLCYGCVHVTGTENFLFFGPLTTNSCDNARAQRILRRCGLPTTEAGQLLSYLRGTPMFSYQKFCHFILFAHYVINHEEIDVTALLGKEYTFLDENPAEMPTAVDNTTVHDAYDYENTMYSFIRLGQYEKMKEFLKDTSYRGNEGMLADDKLRHYKNLVISSITLASRSALEGGLDYETAMRLADACIQKVELAPDMKALIPLHFNMLKTYARLVWEHKHNHADGGISVRVHHYIDAHIGEKLTGQNIANALGISRTYLSSQFKQETGTSLSDFINQTKIDEAKLLLTTTDLPLSEIAGQLSFSSQSHLHTVFKNMTGITPAEYRKRQR